VVCLLDALNAAILFLQVAGMSGEVFAASREFSALLGGLLQAAGAPADEALAWLQQQYWQQQQEKQDKQREEKKKRQEEQEVWEKEQERKQQERGRASRKEQDSRRGGKRWGW
jgi:chromatin remodeling complex protein RSC6